MVPAVTSWYQPFSLINCRATSCWNFSKLSKSSFMWKSMRKGRPSSVSSCTENKIHVTFLPFPKDIWVIPAIFKARWDSCFRNSWNNITKDINCWPFIEDTQLTQLTVFPSPYHMQQFKDKGISLSTFQERIHVQWNSCSKETVRFSKHIFIETAIRPE